MSVRPYIHINRPRYDHYVVRWHERGRQKYNVVSQHRSRKAAMRALFKWVTDRGPTARWNRADVLAHQDWYGFTKLIEVAI